MKFRQAPGQTGTLRSKKALLLMLDDVSRAIADKAGSDERTLAVSFAAVGFSAVVASVFIWAL
jgi:hypothetical protein